MSVFRLRKREEHRTHGPSCQLNEQSVDIAILEACMYLHLQAHIYHSVSLDVEMSFRIFSPTLCNVGKVRDSGRRDIAVGAVLIFALVSSVVVGTVAF